MTNKKGELNTSNKNEEEVINYLGIDWGEKRIGLATADSDVCLALPFFTVSSLDELIGVIKEEQINVIVLGEPVKMSGARADNVLWLKFLDDLKSKVDKKIVLIDERLSSLASDALGGDASRDDMAASLILQSYLDQNCGC